MSNDKLRAYIAFEHDDETGNICAYVVGDPTLKDDSREAAAAWQAMDILAKGLEEKGVPVTAVEAARTWYIDGESRRKH